MLKTNIIVFVIVFFVIFLSAFKVSGDQQPSICLKRNYELYKKNFMSDDGRIIDYERDDITTSEGQSYMLLQSLIMDDRVTFGLAYKWAKDNLQKENKLFAWKWGRNQNGEYKILDSNSASDADIDIAFALVSAYERWGEYQYLEEAKPIIISIWYNETKIIGNNLVLMPGEIQAKSEKTEINPSYFSPFAFKLFQKYDELHDWSLLVDSSYYYLNEICKKTQTHLPSNWFLIENGQIVLENNERGDFSYDAVRVFPRIYFDYVQTHDYRALAILERSKFFIDKWKNTKTFYTNYQADGQLRDKNVFTGSRMVMLPIINHYDRKVANDMFIKEIRPSIEKESFWSDKKEYYGKNLTWFGYYAYCQNAKYSLEQECPSKDN